MGKIEVLRAFLMSLTFTMAVLGGWVFGFPYGCYALLLFFLLWAVIAASFIDLKMHERRCLQRCYLQPHTFLAKIIVSPVAVSLLYFLLSFTMALSAAIVLTEMPRGVWFYLPLHTLIMLFLFRGLTRLFRNGVKEEYLALFAREWSINLSALFLIGALFYTIYQGDVPAYVRTGLADTVRMATNSVGSACFVTDTVLRFNKELEAVSWWFMTHESAVVTSEAVRVTGWFAFLLFNSLAVLGVNRFIAQTIYLIEDRLV